MTDKKRIEDALNLIIEYGGIDGGHHKQWVLDQLARILAEDYDAWLADFRGEWDEEYGCWEYEWDEGIAP